MMSMTNIQSIANFTNEKIAGCRFVGISDDNEVFIEFEHNNQEWMQEAKSKLLQEFPEVKEVVSVVRPSIQTLTEMVEALNAIVDEPQPSKPREPDLLDIESF